MSKHALRSSKSVKRRHKRRLAARYFQAAILIARDPAAAHRAHDLLEDDLPTQLQLPIEVCLTIANLPEATSNVVDIIVRPAKDRKQERGDCFAQPEYD